MSRVAWLFIGLLGDEEQWSLRKGDVEILECLMIS
jgi:hypothetical protein